MAVPTRKEREVEPPNAAGTPMGKARVDYIAACTQSNDWRAEMRPTSETSDREWARRYPIDLVDPRTGRVLGNVSIKLKKSDADFYVTWMKQYRREHGHWPLLESVSSGGTLYYLWPPDPEEDAANNPPPNKGKAAKATAREAAKEKKAPAKAAAENPQSPAHPQSVIPMTSSEIEIPWHSALKPAREQYWQVTGPGNGWFAELRPGTTEWGRIDIVDPRTRQRLGCAPKSYDKKWEAFAQEHKAKTGAWPLVQAIHRMGSLYVLVPLVVVGIDGVATKETPSGKTTQGFAAVSPVEKSGGFLSRLFGKR